LIPTNGPLNPDSDYSVIVKGVTKNIDTCVWVSKTSKTTYTTDPPVQSETQINCPTPIRKISAADSRDVGQWDLYLRNSKTNQESLRQSFLFYENPRIEYIFPTSGDAFGGHIINLVGKGFKLDETEFTNYRLTFRLDKTISQIKCTIYNDTNAGCIAPPNPQKNGAFLAISFNENQFYEYPNATEGKYNVKACDIGKFSLTFETKCEFCAKGYYKPSEGFFECIPCQPGSYVSLLGQRTCLNCPLNTISKEGSTNITNCDCKKDFYRTSLQSGVDCITCVDGGICNGGGVLPYPKKGYYWKRNSVDSPFDFVKCVNEEYCTGNTTNGAEGCIEGRTGLLCELCAANYFKSSGKCEKCNTEVQWRMILVIVGLFVLILLFFKFAQLKVSHLSSFSIAVSYYQIIAVFSAYNFRWPDALKTVLGYMKFLNLDLDIFVPECISVITYAMKWAATICIPIIFAALLLLGFLLEVARVLLAKLWGPLIRRIFSKLYFVNRQNWITTQFSLLVISTIDFFARSRNMKELGDFGDKCIHTFVIVISFSYVFVVTKAAQIFNCSTIDKTLRMVSEQTVICFQNDWWIYFPFSIITLLTFGLGVIALFGYILLFKKKIQADKRFNARFRFLFVRFRDERLYWEIIIILRKLFISIAIIFFSGFPMLVVLFSMFIIFVAFILQTHQTPFRREFHNLMEYVVLLSTLILLFCALLFYVDEFPYEWSKEALGILCVAVIVGSSILIALIVFLDFLKQFWDDAKESSKKKLQILEGDENSQNVEMREQDIILSKFGLKRRINQTTVIVTEDGEELVKTNVTTEQETGDEIKLEKEKKIQVLQETSSVTLLDDNRTVVELEDIKINEVGVNEVSEQQTGIAEVPDDE
jgi:hypothetical protein